MLVAISIFFACNSDYTPKPRGYFKIHFPEKKYQVFDQPGYPYAFEYPVYGNVVKDSSFLAKPPKIPGGLTLNFLNLTGAFMLAIKTFAKNNFDKLIQDVYKMTNKHTTKAYSIEDSVFTNPNNVQGVFFNVGGNVATANQFFMTDLTKHFLRGALYFDATPNEDSLNTVNRFLIQDVRHLIKTFRWK